jgi:hypothetical protein
MIPKQARMIPMKTGRTIHQDSRPTYGKIKFAPPSGRQAIGMACLPAGASVGARAARSRKRNDTNIVFGTRPIRLFAGVDE